MLAKTPADLFNTAAEFIDAVKAGFDAQPTPRSLRRLPPLVAVVVTVAAAVAIAILALTGKSGRQRRSLALGERTQLANSANVLNLVILADGKQLAYFLQRCMESGCTAAIRKGI